jgi:NADH:quinone reductase (non-electrogenic)
MQIFRDHHRVLDNEAAQAVSKLEAQGITDFEAYRSLVQGENTRRAYETGDFSYGMIDYGQAMVFANEIKSVEAIYDELIDDALAAQARLGTLAIGRSEQHRSGSGNTAGA